MTDGNHSAARTTGYRTYEIYQRARPGETTELIKPRQLSSDAYLLDPYPLVAVLREHYPCYRDWPGNAFWVTRYDDVTSVFADEANFETRSRATVCGRPAWGRDLGGELDVLRCLERTADEHGEEIVRRLVGELDRDLATEVLARFPFELLCTAMAVEPTVELARRYLLIQRAPSWDPTARQQGLDALDALAAWAEPLLAERRGLDGSAAGDDLISIVAAHGGTGADLAVTLLEMDHGTLHGVLANLWFHLLAAPDRLNAARREPLSVKAAVLETLRHSPPIVSVDRFARHEVERFGRLLPAGALVRLSAAAANRDPRVFDDPDVFDVHRRDLCQREPRGQYRADGLPSGISFGTGAPSKHPAVPEDRPRSRYAITRDLAMRATRVILDEVPSIRLADGAAPRLRSLRLGEIHTCWSLPVVSG
jgi:pulcherriminic acid synthase